jgi:hypothetical protein
MSELVEMVADLTLDDWNNERLESDIVNRLENSSPREQCVLSGEQTKKIIEWQQNHVEVRALSAEPGHGEVEGYIDSFSVEKEIAGVNNVEDEQTHQVHFKSLRVHTTNVPPVINNFNAMTLNESEVVEVIPISIQPVGKVEVHDD